MSTPPTVSFTPDEFFTVASDPEDDNDSVEYVLDQDSIQPVESQEVRK